MNKRQFLFGCYKYNQEIEFKKLRDKLTFQWKKRLQSKIN